MPTDDELRLAEVLADAEAERVAELERLSAMDDAQVAYLHQVDTLEDPETGGIECSGDV